MKSTNRLLVISAMAVTCLITANIIAVKLVSIWTIVLPAAVIIFPLNYILGDIITEVYGYRWARRVIWLGFGCNLIFVFFSWISGLLPPAPLWENQDSFDTILGYTPRLLLASFAGYLVGSFANSLVLARLKVITGGKWLWLRTIASTIVGEGFDTAIFIIIAFIATPAFTPLLILYHWCAKVAIEVVATPLTYRAVAYLKRKDGVDTYDQKTNFNPFSMQ
ncbi:MAG: queuosine precursor transporter [Dehalococcoidia bacterium]|nr:queuosine precursor transporter [Dehalococcoidia bacterium]